MMAVKLYNLSKLPDEPMRSILTAAKLAVGASGDVVTKVTRGGRCPTSYAHTAAFVYRSFLSRRSHTKKDEWRSGMVRTNGGYVVMQPRWVRCKSAVDGLASAEQFFKTAVHEFAHIVQFQARFGKFAQRCKSGRRVKWERRPEEIDAVNRTDEALDRLAKRIERRQQIDEWIIEFGIQIERMIK